MRSARRRPGAVLVGVICVLVAAGACSADDDEPAAQEDTIASTTSTSAPPAPAGSDDCAGAQLMDAAALGVEADDPEGLARAVAEALLAWSDATVSAADRPCAFRVASPSHELAVTLEVRSDAAGRPRLAKASSFSHGEEPPALGVQLLKGRGDRVTSNAACPRCAAATVHVPYAGGVTSVEVGVPVEASLDVPDGARQRGVVVLLRSASGAVEAVVATSVPDGDFAAG